MHESTPPLRHTAQAWGATHRGAGVDADGVVHAHHGAVSTLGHQPVRDRARREAIEAETLRHGATRAHEAGERARPEAPDPLRTCFERDRDRILHAEAFRRLAGKTQVFLFPADHQRTRLTHALEVAQVAGAIARAAGLNVALTEAIALAHDCGHGPGGHASEEAFDIYLPEGFDHAVWGADVVAAPLNLCAETLDGIRNHSWSRPAPATPEGAVVSWADRIAYVCHDFEDGVATGVVSPDDLPDVVRRRCGGTHSAQLAAFIGAVVATIDEHGTVGMDVAHAEALAAYRQCNYERIYLRDESVAQRQDVIALLRALVEWYLDHPEPGRHGWTVREVVAWVAGMTDSYACAVAVDRLGWQRDRLPVGVREPGL